MTHPGTQRTSPWARKVTRHPTSTDSTRTRGTSQGGPQLLTIGIPHGTVPTTKISRLGRISIFDFLPLKCALPTCFKAARVTVSFNIFGNVGKHHIKIMQLKLRITRTWNKLAKLNKCSFEPIVKCTYVLTRIHFY